MRGGSRALRTRWVLAYGAVSLGCGALLGLEPTHGDPDRGGDSSIDASIGGETGTVESDVDSGDGAPARPTCGTGAPVVLETDQKHCGGCFHPCEGTDACTAGFCRIALRAPATTNANARLTVFFENFWYVYFTTGTGKIWWFKYDSPAPFSFRDTEPNATLIAHGGQSTGEPPSVYWARNAVPVGTFEVRGGGANDSQYDVSGPALNTPIRGLAVTSNGVAYYTTAPNLRSFTATGSINDVVIPQTSEPWGVAASGTEVYWTDRVLGTVSRVSPSCVVATSQNHPTEIAASPTHVYWVTDNGIARAPVALCNANTKVEVVLSGLTGDRVPTALVADQLNDVVYWTDRTRVYRLALTKGPTPLALTPDLLTNLRPTLGTTGTDVYFMDDDGVHYVAGGVTR